jgi:hypothetical protein
LIRASIIVGAATVAVGIAVASGDWSAAKSKADEYKRKEDDVKKMVPAETRKIVTAICEADDDSRKSAADSASSSARSNLNDKFNELERTKRDAVELLDHVMSDDKLKDDHSNASQLESDIKSRWDKTNELTRSLRNGNHPVIEFMLKHGESARHERADHCDAKDISLDFGHADCVMARGDTCTVVEITADNSRAISKGRDRASRGKSQLESELKKSSSDILKQLINRKSDFGKCKHFEARVDCYKECPSVDDGDRYNEQSPSWREGC